jgi:ParB family chromosome partitioning protein
LRLLQLSPPVQKFVRDGSLSAGHAKALLSIEDPSTQEALARKAAKENWSVRAVEEAARRGGVPSEDPAIDLRTPTPQTPQRLREPGLLEVENLLGELLATRVQIQMGNKRGKVVVEFADLSDLERIYRIVAASPEATQVSTSS